jgi:hypothetical protein
VFYVQESPKTEILIRYLGGITIGLESRDSTVGIMIGCGLDNRMIGVRFPAGAGNFSLHHRVQTGSGAHPASYQMGTAGSFPGHKAAGA